MSPADMASLRALATGVNNPGLWFIHGVAAPPAASFNVSRAFCLCGVYFRLPFFAGAVLPFADVEIQALDAASVSSEKTFQQTNVLQVWCLMRCAALAACTVYTAMMTVLLCVDVLTPPPLLVTSNFYPPPVVAYAVLSSAAAAAVIVLAILIHHRDPRTRAETYIRAAPTLSNAMINAAGARK